MSPLLIVLIILIVLAFVGGGWGYTNQGPYVGGGLVLVGLLLVILLVLILAGVIHVG